MARCEPAALAYETQRTRRRATESTEKARPLTAPFPTDSVQGDAEDAEKASPRRSVVRYTIRDSRLAFAVADPRFSKSVWPSSRRPTTFAVSTTLTDWIVGIKVARSTVFAQVRNPDRCAWRGRLDGRCVSRHRVRAFDAVFLKTGMSRSMSQRNVRAGFISQTYDPLLFSLSVFPSKRYSWRNLLTSGSKGARVHP